MLRRARWGWLTLALLAAWPAAAGPLAERLRERWQIGQAEARANLRTASSVFMTSDLRAARARRCSGWSASRAGATTGE